MKKQVMTAGLLLLIGAACNRSQSYEITGSIPGMKEDATIELTGVAADGKDSLLTTAAISGEAVRIPVDGSCEMVCLRLPEARRKFPVFFEPEVKNYRLAVDTAGQVRIEGGALQEVWNEYQAGNAAFERRKAVVEAAYRAAEKADDLFAKMHERAVYADLETEQEQFEDSLLRANDNIVAATIVWMRSRALAAGDRIGEKVALLGPNARQTAPGRAVKRMTDAMISTENGSIAPDFTQEDPQGNPVSLYGIQARVKVLDFWASWCGPCRAETPNMRRIYDKYKDKGLAIISVSLDTKRENWLQAIESDRMEWIHTSDLQGWDNAVARQYGVRSVPAIFVLDADNRIVGQNLRGQELEETIQKLLNE